MRQYSWMGVTLRGTLLLLLICGIAAAGDAAGKPLVHPLFTDNAVLQRDIEVPVWGWARPGQKVEVALTPEGGDPVTVTATAAEDGKWAAKIGPRPAGAACTLTVAADETHTSRNILFGDVWICSGQSNMEMGVGSVDNAKEEIATADFPKIHLLTVPKRIAYDEQEIFEGRWLVCSPETLVGYGWGGFSATGYFFGRTLHQELDIPIGLIHTSWGGTIAEAWTSREALAADELFQPALTRYLQVNEQLQEPTYDYNALVEAWWKGNDVGSAADPQWSSSSFDDTAWKTMALPQNWEKAQQGMDTFDGLVWFRRTIELPEGWAEQELVLNLGPIDDIDTTFINGAQVGTMIRWNTPRSYRIPAGTCRPGMNVIAVRVMDNGGGGGFHGKPEQMTIAPAKSEDAPALSLAGDWKYAVTKEKEQLPAFPQKLEGNPNIPTVLYNGMIAPLLPYAIKGAVWYQGESNAWNAPLYRTLLPTMIRDWRSRFTSTGDGAFPFGIVMLAGFYDVAQTPVQDGWAALREAQLLTASHLPNVGLASAVDIGDAKDIHPRNKQDVGRRLAQWMLGTVYGKDVVPSGPIYDSMKVEGNTIRLQFRNVGGGLVAQGDQPLKWFAICGADKTFVAADAKIDGDTVVVSAEGVAEPVAVRYAWANNPEGANLYNKEGLPAFPFRTDVD